MTTDPAAIHRAMSDVRVFSVDDRLRLHDRVLELAAADKRVVAGAVVGSLAHGVGDRWSDLDLTFAVVDGVAVGEVLEDWIRTLAAELGAARLFDVPADVRETFRGALVASLDRDELFRALGCAIDGLLGEAAALPGLADTVTPQLRALQTSWMT